MDTKKSLNGAQAPSHNDEANAGFKRGKHSYNCDSGQTQQLRPPLRAQAEKPVACSGDAGQNPQEQELGNEQNGGKSVARSTALMSICTLVSRATGFVRTWAMAFALGNTIMAAGFSLANNLPNMIYELVAGGVLSTAFLPIYLQQRNQKGKQAGSAYASNLLSIVVVALGLISLIASIFAPQVMVTQSLFSSASSDTVTAAVWLFRFLAFEILFYGVSAVLSGILNAEREFFWPAISSVFMNIVAIVGFFAYPFIVDYDPSLGTTWLGITMLLSIAVMAFVQVPALLKTGIKLRPLIDFHGEGFKDTIKLALPAIACTAINLVALSFMNSCALNVDSTGPASMSYAWMWYQFPYGVLCVALSTALFTELSDCASKKDWSGFKEHLLAGLRTTWLLIIPMASMVFACADQLIGLYASGRFTADNIEPIARLLRGWALCLPAYAAYMFVYRAYSAMKDMKTVALCNLCLTVLQVLGYMLFTGVLNPRFSIGLPGLAASDLVFYCLMLITLLLILRRRASDLDLPSLIVPVIKVSVASAAGCAAAMFTATLLADFVGVSSTLQAFANLIVCGVVGLLVIYVICRVLHVDEISRFAAAIKRKVRR